MKPKLIEATHWRYERLKEKNGWMFENGSTVETDLQIGRYVDLASQIDITMERQRFLWWMTARPCIHPLLN